MIQVQEEVAHAKILRHYLLDNGVNVKMSALEEPTKTFENDLEPLEEGLKHEEYVTSLVNGIRRAFCLYAQSKHD